MTQVEFLQKMQELKAQMHENKKNYDERLLSLAKHNKQLVDEENESWAGQKQEHQEILEDLANRYHKKVQDAKNAYHDAQHRIDMEMADLKIAYVTEHPDDNPNKVF